jgi:ketosteroid isomerase-like protein
MATDTKSTARKPRPRRTKAKIAEDLGRSYFDAIARQDLDGIASHYSPDLVVEFIGQGIYRGPQEMRDFFAGLFAAIPDAEMVTDRVVGGDGVVVVEWRLRGNFTGSAPLFGIEPTGRWIEQRGCDVIEFAEGKITRNTAYQDGMEMARSIGMMPPMDSPAERGMKQAFNLATRARRAMKDRFGQGAR